MKRELGVLAADQAIADLSKYQMPDIKNNKIVTLNSHGYMKLEPDIFSKKFIHYKTSLPMLEIGTAYGFTAKAALLNGATIIANDLDLRHLLILREQVPMELRANLYLKHAAFPNELNFQEHSLGAVLMCRVAHFLSQNQIVDGLKKIHSWLEPKGKLFFVSLAPSHRLFKEKFFPLYQQRMESGDEWPGIIDNMREYNPDEAEDIPDFLHVFDKTIIEKLLPKFGFIIREMELFDNDGYIGFIAEKVL